MRPYVKFCYENKDEDLDGFKLDDLGDIRAPEHNFVQSDMTTLEKHWDVHSQSGSKHPLAWTIWDTYKGLMIVNFCKHIIPRFFMQQFVEQYAMLTIMEYLQRETPDSEKDRAGWIAFAVLLLYMCIEKQIWHWCDLTKGFRTSQSNDAWTSLMYKKLLRLQQGSCTSDYPEGKVLQVISDSRVEHIINHQIRENIYFVADNIIAVVILLKYFGWGLVTVVALSTVGLYYVRKLRRNLEDMHKEREKIGEDRGSYLNEVFNNIRMLKLYGWQKLFTQRVISKHAEGNEIDREIRKKEQLLDKIVSVISQFISPLGLAIFMY